MNKLVDDVFHVEQKHIATMAEIENCADTLDLSLTNERWEAIKFIRNYIKSADIESLNSHVICQELKKEFYLQGGYKYMYELFPNGPVNTICKLLNIDIVDANEKQFGVVH